MSTISCCFFPFFVHYFFQAFKLYKFAKSQQVFSIFHRLYPSRPSMFSKWYRCMGNIRPVSIAAIRPSNRERSDTRYLPSVGCHSPQAWTLIIPLLIPQPPNVLSPDWICPVTTSTWTICLLIRPLRDLQPGFGPCTPPALGLLLRGAHTFESEIEFDMTLALKRCGQPPWLLSLRPPLDRLDSRSEDSPSGNLMSFGWLDWKS